MDAEIIGLQVVMYEIGPVLKKKFVIVRARSLVHNCRFLERSKVRVQDSRSLAHPKNILVLSTKENTPSLQRRYNDMPRTRGGRK